MLVIENGPPHRGQGFNQYLKKSDSYPFGPTKPYLLPAVILRFAFTKRSLPRAEILNFST